MSALDPYKFYEILKKKDVDFFVGVPDSLLKEFNSVITSGGNDIIAANEGNAMGIAAGHYLATGHLALVYLQNSGFGNIINPLTSLADPAVYGIPMLILMGWRGEPGVKDEPQHVKQGAVNEAMLRSMDIEYCILEADIQQAKTQIETAYSTAEKGLKPYVVLVRQGIFGKADKPKILSSSFPMKRETALEIILSETSDKDILVSTTGKTSREIFEFRSRTGTGHDRDFLTVGSMGHASSIALGIARSKPDRRIICVDGDGALLMHMGSLAIIGTQCCSNYYHIVINNGAHESVGGQPTVAHQLDLEKIAMGCKYRTYMRATNEDELKTSLTDFRGSEGPLMLEICVDLGARPDLGRPTIPPHLNKMAFMENLRKR